MRQIDDIPETSELERQLDEVYSIIVMLEKEAKNARSAIASNDPFKVMSTLAEINRLVVKDAMPLTIAAQDEFLRPIKADAQRIP